MRFLKLRNGSFKLCYSNIRQGYTAPSRLRLKRSGRKKRNKESEEIPYLFHPRVRTLEPIIQALRNTKSLIKYELPLKVTSMDDFMCNEIFPQVKSTFSQDTGVNSLNMEDFLMTYINAVWKYGNSYPGLLKQTISYRPGLNVSWRRYGHNLQISGRTGLLFSSMCALPNFSLSEEVQKTACKELMGKDELISPVFELSQKISGMEFDRGFYQDLYPFPQMLVIAEHNWKLDHLVAQAIMFSFGRLFERAVCKNDAIIGDVLREPLSIRAIVHNEQTFSLMCYQLNTLDFGNDDGIKNQLWLSKPFSATMHKDSKEKSENNNVGLLESSYKDIISFFLYGQG